MYRTGTYITITGEYPGMVLSDGKTVTVPVYVNNNPVTGVTPDITGITIYGMKGAGAATVSSVSVNTLDRNLVVLRIVCTSSVTGYSDTAKPCYVTLAGTLTFT